MARNSSVNLDISNLSVGFSIAGGATKRTLTVNGSGNTTLTAQQNIVLTLPNRSSDTVLGFKDYTAKGIILIGTGSGTFTALSVGTDTFVLTADSGQTSGVKWAAAAAGTVTSVSGTANRITSTGGATPVIDISALYVGQTSITTLGTIATGTWQGTAIDATHGGTNQTSWATGDILYASGANTLAKLAAGSNTQVLTLVAGVPSWQTPAAGTVTSVSGTSNRITSTGGATPVIDISSLYVGQTSITTLGTIATGTWQGTAIDATHGGTGQTSWTTGDILYASGSNTLSKLAAGVDGSVLQLAGGVPVWGIDGGGGLQYVSGTLTNSQVKNLHATPIQAIAAPGSGKVIVVVQAIGKLNYGGSNAFTAGASQSIQVYYGTAQQIGQSSSSILKNAALTSTSSQVGMIDGGGGGTGAFSANYSDLNNAAVNIYNPIATEISGNGANNNTVSWGILYYIATI